MQLLSSRKTSSIQAKHHCSTKTDVVKQPRTQVDAENDNDTIGHVLQKHRQRAAEVLGSGGLLTSYALHVESILDQILYDFTVSYADSALASKRKKHD